MTQPVRCDILPVAVGGIAFRQGEIYLGVAQFGSVLEWGSRGRKFESSHPDMEDSAVMRLRSFVYQSGAPGRRKRAGDGGPMIIDIHTHTLPPAIAPAAFRAMQNACHTALFTDGTESGLIAAKNRAGIGLAVVQPVATNPGKVSRINDHVIVVNQSELAGELLSFGAMHPACPAWERELERLKEAGVPGIKLHPPYADIDIDDPRYVAILRKCRDLGLIVLTHSGLDIGIPGSLASVPDKVRRALDQTGPMTFIAAHMGGWRRWEETMRLLSDTGIYLDTSFSLGVLTPADDGHDWEEKDLRMLTEDAFCEMIERFRPDHILFGTDCPWADPEREIRNIRALPLPASDLAMILGGNAERLLADSKRDSD